jgi:acylphosphatase
VIAKLRQFRHVFVEGAVQGVGYRDFVRRWAIRLDVTGWVRNRSDGSVEALLQGAGGDMDSLIIEMRKGPRGSEIARLRVEDKVADDAEASGAFVILPNA